VAASPVPQAREYRAKVEGVHSRASAIVTVGDAVVGAAGVPVALAEARTVGRRKAVRMPDPTEAVAAVPAPVM
jgi:hypothetical protein